MPHAGQDAADLSVTALIEHHNHVGAIAAFALHFDRLNLAETIGKMDAPLQLVQLRLVWFARNSDEVGLLHAIARMGQPIRKLAIVGDDDQPFAEPVQPTDRKDSLFRGY
jgi:hypothetical protein